MFGQWQKFDLRLVQTVFHSWVELHPSVADFPFGYKNLGRGIGSLEGKLPPLDETRGIPMHAYLSV